MEEGVNFQLGVQPMDKQFFTKGEQKLNDQSVMPLKAQNMTAAADDTNSQIINDVTHLSSPDARKKVFTSPQFEFDD